MDITLKTALDNALTEIDSCVSNYRRGLFTALEVSNGIFDVLLDLSLNNMRQLYAEIIPLAAEYIILDKYALSQFKNVIQEWKSNWKIGIYRFMEEINATVSLSDKEKQNYYRVYLVLNYYPEYKNEI